jgi:hypothetical protein
VHLVVDHQNAAGALVRITHQHLPHWGRSVAATPP